MFFGSRDIKLNITQSSLIGPTLACGPIVGKWIKLIVAYGVLDKKSLEQALREAVAQHGFKREIPMDELVQEECLTETTKESDSSAIQSVRVLPKFNKFYTERRCGMIIVKSGHFTLAAKCNNTYYYLDSLHHEHPAFNSSDGLANHLDEVLRIHQPTYRLATDAFQYMILTIDDFRDWLRAVPRYPWQNVKEVERKLASFSRGEDHELARVLEMSAREAPLKASPIIIPVTEPVPTPIIIPVTEPEPAPQMNICELEQHPYLSLASQYSKPVTVPVTVPVTTHVYPNASLQPFKTPTMQQFNRPFGLPSPPPYPGKPNKPAMPAQLIPPNPSYTHKTLDQKIAEWTHVYNKEEKDPQEEVWDDTLLDLEGMDWEPVSSQILADFSQNPF